MRSLHADFRGFGNHETVRDLYLDALPDRSLHLLVGSTELPVKGSCCITPAVSGKIMLSMQRQMSRKPSVRQHKA